MYKPTQPTGYIRSEVPFTTHHHHAATSAQFLPTLINTLLHTAPNPEELLSLICSTTNNNRQPTAAITATTTPPTPPPPPLHIVKLSYHQRKAFDFLLHTTLFTSTLSTPSSASSATPVTTTHSNTTTDIQQLVITEEDRQLLARIFLLTFIHCPTAPFSFKYLAYETPEQLIRLFHILNHAAPALRQQLHQQRQQHQKTTRLFVLTVAYHLLHAQCCKLICPSLKPLIFPLIGNITPFTSRIHPFQPFCICVLLYFITTYRWKKLLRANVYSGGL